MIFLKIYEHFCTQSYLLIFTVTELLKGPYDTEINAMLWPV